jgi:hypothetical protein
MEQIYDAGLIANNEWERSICSSEFVPRIRGYRRAKIIAPTHQAFGARPKG